MRKHVLTALLLCLALCLPALGSAENTKLKLDIVWVVDCTGSMPSNINNVRNQLADFAGKKRTFTHRKLI